jgi:hypothetical protein
MGRPLEERGSQKTCLNARVQPSRTGCSREILRIKKGNPRIDPFGPGIFLCAQATPKKEVWNMKKVVSLAFFVCLLSSSWVSAAVIDFEDLTLSAESYWNGSDGSGAFSSGGATFSNNYNAQWESWDGFSYSNLTDHTTEGFAGQYSAIAGGGALNTDTYVIGYCSAFAASPPTVTFSTTQTVTGVYVTNNNYAYYSMLKGDQFAKQFEEGDWFRLTITGKDADGNVTGTVDFNLATGTDIVDTWEWIDLRSLGTVKSLEFTLSSSDTGEFGMNTPSYFAMDFLNPPDEDSSGCFINTLFSGNNITPQCYR